MLEIILLTTLTGTAAFLIDSAIEHVTEQRRPTTKPKRTQPQLRPRD